MDKGLKIEIISSARTLYRSISKIMTSSEFEMLVRYIKHCLRTDNKDKEEH